MKDPAATAKAFESLYNEWRKHVGSPETQLASHPGAYTDYPAFRDIIGLGEPALPFLVEKLKHGEASGWKEAQFFLWRAARDISGVDLTPRGKTLGEQDMARRYVAWWETRKT